MDRMGDISIRICTRTGFPLWGNQVKDEEAFDAERDFGPE